MSQGKEKGRDDGWMVQARQGEDGGEHNMKKPSRTVRLWGGEAGEDI